MKFTVGLLVGAVATLLVASLTTYRWEPPSRLALATASVSSSSQDVATPVSEFVAQSATKGESKPVQQSESKQRLEAVPKPIRSVTIEPLLPDVAPKPPPKPEQRFASELVDTSAQRTGVIDKVDTAVIWKPFHSEVSAIGFARRLSVQLGYPFRTLREGPARYHVVFDYDTEQQRELLLKQVSALTGFTASS